MDIKKVTKEILNKIGNDTTKIEIKEEFKGNYYSYLTDTIYLSNKDNKKSNNDINPNLGKIVMLCHECIHSIQSKALHILNTIFSNLSIILIVLGVVLLMFSIKSIALYIATIVIATMSIVVRLILEFGAITGSIKLAEDVCKDMKEVLITKADITKARKYMRKMLPVAILSMIMDKLLIVIVLLIMCIK